MLYSFCLGQLQKNVNGNDRRRRAKIEKASAFIHTGLLTQGQPTLTKVSDIFFSSFMHTGKKSHHAHHLALWKVIIERYRD